MITSDPVRARHATQSARIGGAVSAIGACALAVSLRGSTWYLSSGGFTFDHIRGLKFARAFSQAYFSWIAYAFVAAVVVLALASFVPSRLRVALATLCLVTGVLGILATMAALGNRRHPFGVFHHAGVGVYFMLVGLIAVGAGALLAARLTSANDAPAL